MARRRRKNKAYDDLTDALFSLCFFAGLWAWIKTQSILAGGMIFAFTLAILFCVITLYKNAKKKQLLQSGIDIIDNMDGRTFEKLLLEHFKEQGYKGHLTPASGDYGADLLIEKDNRKIVIQAKRWKQNVGIEAVQQVIGAIKHYKAHKGMVITNSHFTDNAYKLAGSNEVELWDRDKLVEFMKNSKGRELAQSIIQSKPAASSIDDSSMPSKYLCPVCGNKLIIKNGKRGRFWSCTDFPNCRFTRDYSRT